MSLDSTTWAALAFVLAALGAGWTYVSFQRRGITAGVRGIAWTLLPVAAWLTGTLELAGDIVADVGHWASRLVFSPVVWIGIVLAGISVVLLGATSLVRRRAVGPAAGGEDAGALAQERTRASRKRPAEVGSRPAPDAGTGLDDDVSEILRKHGIS